MEAHSRIGGLIGWFAIITCIQSSARAWTPTPKKLPGTTIAMPLYFRPNIIEEGNNLFVNLGGAFGTHPLAHQAGFVELGFAKNYFAFDLRFKNGVSHYAQIGVEPGTFDNDPSPITYNNNGNAPWKYWLVEPGLSIISNPFIVLAPWLSTRVRTGLGYGTFTDLSSGYAFTTWTYSAESSLGFRLGEHSPWMMWTGLGWYFGRGMTNLGEISNFSWLQENVSLSWHF